MNKKKLLIMSAIAAAIVFVAIIITNIFCPDYSGVYATESWNGKYAELILYEDGTCGYPTGGDAIWKKDGKTIVITTNPGTLEKRDHICKMIDDGFVLHDHYFKKIS